MKKRLGRQFNKEGTYAIRVVRTKEIIKKFRTSSGARNMIPHYKNIVMEPLEVVEL